MTTSANHARDDAPGHPGAVAPAAADDHGDDHGHGGDAGHGSDAPLGPIDVLAWGAGVLGVILGLVVAVCFMLATGDVPG